MNTPLLAAGLGIEHYFDVRLDEKEARAGIEAGGTPRTIEGPLYVAGAPVSAGEARLDDDSDDGEILFMDGQVTDAAGRPIAGAAVEVWHADTHGLYSFFDKSQSPFNLRRTITTDAEGRYPLPQHHAVRLWLPADRPDPAPARPARSARPAPGAYSFHGNRPRVNRQLTTQINIQGDVLSSTMISPLRPGSEADPGSHPSQPTRRRSASAA